MQVSCAPPSTVKKTTDKSTTKQENRRDFFFMNDPKAAIGPVGRMVAVDIQRFMIDTERTLRFTAQPSTEHLSFRGSVATEEP